MQWRGIILQKLTDPKRIQDSQMQSQGSLLWWEECVTYRCLELSECSPLSHAILSGYFSVLCSYSRLVLPYRALFQIPYQKCGCTCKIWGFHCGDYEEWHLLGCYAVWLLQEPTYFYFVLLRSVRRLLVTANVVPSSPILVTLMMKALSSFETSVFTRSTRRYIPENAILLGCTSFL
jgi:hypothetical protein